MSQLPVAEDPSTCGPQGWNLLKSMSTGVISAVSDANVIAVLIVFIVVCLLALNVNVITPDASLAIPIWSIPLIDRHHGAVSTRGMTRGLLKLHGSRRNAMTKRLQSSRTLSPAVCQVVPGPHLPGTSISTLAVCD